MPIITSIEVQKRNKNRVNVFVDDEFFCGMETVSVLKAGLKTGREVDSATLQQTVFESEAESAFSKCIDYLSRAMKTEREIFNYLIGKGFSQDVAVFVVEKLKGYKYVDDTTYAHMFISQGLASKGALRLRLELLKKGVERELVERLLSEVDEKVYTETAESMAQKFLKNKPRDLKTLQKMQRHLLSRGFSFDEVNQVVQKFKKEDTDDWY